MTDPARAERARLAAALDQVRGIAWKELTTTTPRSRSHQLAQQILDVLGEVTAPGPVLQQPAGDPDTRRREVLVGDHLAGFVQPTWPFVGAARSKLGWDALLNDTTHSRVPNHPRYGYRTRAEAAEHVAYVWRQQEGRM